MSTKKSSTPRKRTATPSRAELRQRLARDLTAVLSNPECPTTLYNDIAGGVLEIFNSIPTYRLDTSEAYTLALLNEHAAAQAEGGARR